MASSVYVIDSSFHRTQIKVLPAKYLREILDEACFKRKLKPDGYMLKTQNGKAVDLSQPFRLSGLSAGAKLQLVQASRSPTVISVALQLPESVGGGRLTDKFASTSSLWQILRRFEEGVAGETHSKLNLTQQGLPSSTTGSGRLLYQQPCLNTMGRTMEDFETLQKTLAQLGFSSGNVLLRLSFKETNKPLEDAMAQISQYFEVDKNSVVEPASVVSSQGRSTAPAVEALISSSETFDSIDTAGDHIAQDNTPYHDNHSPPDKTESRIKVFLPPAATTPAAALQEEDQSAYEPSIDDARALQASLQRAGKNTRLLSDKELAEKEDERQASLANVQNIDVRIRYPDQSMIQLNVHASETAHDLYTQVRRTLRYPDAGFELRFVGTNGHQSMADDSNIMLVRNLGFRGKVLVTCIWSATAPLQARSSSSLKDELRSKAQTLKVEPGQSPSVKQGNTSNKPAMVNNSSQHSVKGKNVDIEAKMKKFLGFGKK